MMFTAPLSSRSRCIGPTGSLWAHGKAVTTPYVTYISGRVGGLFAPVCSSPLHATLAAVSPTLGLPGPVWALYEPRGGMRVPCSLLDDTANISHLVAPMARLAPTDRPLSAAKAAPRLAVASAARHQLFTCDHHHLHHHQQAMSTSTRPWWPGRSRSTRGPAAPAVRSTCAPGPTTAVPGSNCRRSTRCTTWRSP